MILWGQVIPKKIKFLVGVKFQYGFLLGIVQTFVVFGRHRTLWDCGEGRNTGGLCGRGV